MYFPPQNGFFSRSKHLPPFSKIVCAADKPANPPPTTIT